jgi:hypothetical protein
MIFMTDFVTTNGHTQVIIPLQIKPYSHKAMPTLTGSALSNEAGTVVYGLYNMEYLLPGGDRLRLIANHNKKTVQLMLFTHDPELLKSLPGARPSSLVADMIRRIQLYRLRSESYKQPLSLAQHEKLRLANECINSLCPLLIKERQLAPHNSIGQEALRREVLSVIELCRDGNRMLADNPIVSEGSFGSLLYDSYKAAQLYHFNKAFAVSRQDQMDFTKIKADKHEAACFVWDSELHIGYNSTHLDDALRAICHHYQLIPAAELSSIPANRFAKLETFFRKLWRDGYDWIDYLSFSDKPTHKTDVSIKPNGVFITNITPYYQLKGIAQQGYSNLNKLVRTLTDSSLEPLLAIKRKDAKKMLEKLPNGNWVIVAKNQQIIVRLDNKLVQINYFVQDKLFYPLPEGQDLYTLSQVSKRHLYLPERANLRFNGFISRIPTFFKNFFNGFRQFIVQDLHEDFFNHVHATHNQPKENLDPNIAFKDQTKLRLSLHNALESNGLLANGQTLEEFIEKEINSSPYVIARANHPPSPPLYDNPLHRILGVLRHIAGFFIDTGERNPIVGTFALAAYAYAAGAVLAPKVLTDILIKLHLHGLIAGIEPTQKFAHLLSHGTTSEAISASASFWQATIAGGNLDKFFIEAVTILKDDPAEVAIIASLALSLGYGISRAIPSLQKEMGDFPFTNYAAIGGKSGAALYDIIMHPGEDWLLGTCKWFFKGIISVGKLIIAPFVEGYYYGYQDGFMNGWGKSEALAKRLGKHVLAGALDLLLFVVTIPLIELSALLIHIPFRGITNLCRKILATLGSIGTLGQILITFAKRPSLNNYLSNFRISPLYGFTSPLGHFSDNWLINAGINTLRCLFIPPLQLIKNALILPIIDLVSLTARLVLSLINPASRVLAYLSGTILFSAGSAWDSSLGFIFSSSATGLTLSSNWIDNKAGEFKHYLLSLIEIARQKLYYWSFKAEDINVPVTLDDKEYYLKAPRRLELIPHSDSHCLLNKLLDDETKPLTESTPSAPPQHHDSLFKEAPLVPIECETPAPYSAQSTT